MKMSSLRSLAAGLALILTACSASPLPSGMTRFQNQNAQIAPIARGQSFLPLSPALPKGREARPATVLSYLPIDDGLQEHIGFYLNTLERTTSPRTWQVAFSDALGPENTFFHLIQPDKSDKVVSASSFPAPAIHEMTSNSPNTLASVVEWTYSNYNSPFKAFTYLGHGGGFMGVASDATPGPEGEYASPTGMLRLEDLRSALRRGLKGRKLDLINFHACLMANLEAAYSLRDVARVMYASEDVVGAHQEGTEKPTEILNTLLQQSNPDPYRIAREVAIQVQARQNPYGFATASAIDLDRIEELKQALNVLSGTLIRALPTQRQAILTAYNSVPEFQNAAGTGQRDLWTLSKRLLRVPDPKVQQAAGAVVAAMRRVLIHTRDSEGDAANGLSILMPPPAQAAGYIQQLGYANSPFGKDSGWDEFLLALGR
ncbi:MAG: clostripain-related cysteine peptidase [Candidatus Sericytochromatia bacterium]